MDNSSRDGDRYSSLHPYLDSPEEVMQGVQWVHPTGGAPRTVDIVALGYSMRAYVHQCLRKGLESDAVSDEVWTVNRGIRAFNADLAFILDELPDEIINDPAYGEAIKNYKKPIISTVCADDVGVCSTYPGAAILDCLRTTHGMSITDPYWHNSMPMVMAYALFIGVEQVTLWGCDYQSEAGVSLEDDRANLEYWCGVCRARGMRVGVPTESTLLNQRKTSGGLYVYGLRDQRRAARFLDG